MAKAQWLAFYLLILEIILAKRCISCHFDEFTLVKSSLVTERRLCKQKQGFKRTTCLFGTRYIALSNYKHNRIEIIQVTYSKNTVSQVAHRWGIPKRRHQTTPSMGAPHEAFFFLQGGPGSGASGVRSASSCSAVMSSGSSSTI